MLYVLCWDTSTLSSTCVVVLTGWLCSSWGELDSRIPLSQLVLFLQNLGFLLWFECEISAVGMFDHSIHWSMILFEGCGI